MTYDENSFQQPPQPEPPELPPFNEGGGLNPGYGHQQQHRPIQERIGNGRIATALQQAPAPAPPQPPPRHLQEAVSESLGVRRNIRMLDAGSKAGLYPMADFVAEAIAGYQVKFHETTGQTISFEEALSQIFQVIHQALPS